ncbi:MAG: helix-turn-helix domain-containing protein [Alphaproteobacteria bacterium]|nr:helix-turn-helix domain-containing protein [Alphaproteobacteria bacterium]
MTSTACEGARTRRFTEPDQFQAAVRGGDNLYSVLGPGVFCAELTDIEVGRVKIQRGRETLPRLGASGMPADKVAILTWPHNGRLPVVRGTQVQPGELFCAGPGTQSHHRTAGPNEFAAMTLDVPALAGAASDLTGHELNVASGTLLRPPERLIARLHSLVLSAIRVSETMPQVLFSPRCAESLEEGLLEAIVACLTRHDTREESVKHGTRVAIAKKLEEAIEARLDSPLRVLELCRITGLHERTLRKVCQEQMGVSPSRFLALRRLHMARRALLRADPRSATVTEIAMEHGMWELGRFAVAYKALFGESPSATLRRQPSP